MISSGVLLIGWVLSNKERFLASWSSLFWFQLSGSPWLWSALSIPWGPGFCKKNSGICTTLLSISAGEKLGVLWLFYGWTVVQAIITSLAWLLFLCFCIFSLVQFLTAQVCFLKLGRPRRPKIFLQMRNGMQRTLYPGRPHRDLLGFIPLLSSIFLNHEGNRGDDGSG